MFSYSNAKFRRLSKHKASPDAQDSKDVKTMERELSVGASLDSLGVRASSLVCTGANGVVKTLTSNTNRLVPDALANLDSSEVAPPVNMALEAQRLRRKQKVRSGSRY
jgi:hypothetical protein